MRWVISIPAWGAERRATAVDGPLQSVFAALRQARVERPLIIVNTDALGPFAECVLTMQRDHVPDAEVRFYSISPATKPGMPSYLRFGDCHQQAIDLAAPGDRVALLCADMSVSIEAFAAAETIFGRGKRLILAAASSTVGRAPITSARELLTWSLDNLTPMCRDLFWHEGKGSFPWCVYFRHEHGVDFRGFHLHPFAVVKHEGLTFRGATSDLYLSEEFPTEQVHIVTSPDELALVERSGADRRRPLGFKVRAWTVVGWAVAMGENTSPRHVWHFSHQITLQGRSDPANAAIGNTIVQRIERYRRARGHKPERDEAAAA